MAPSDWSKVINIGDIGKISSRDQFFLMVTIANYNILYT